MIGQNTIKFIKSLNLKKNRQLNKKVILEGYRLIAESIQAGAFYGSFEATMQQPNIEGMSAAKMALVNISNFITEERPYFESTEAIVSMADDEYIEPDNEDSTELGEVPQATKQGSIRKGFVRDPYAMNYLYTLE